MSVFKFGMGLLVLAVGLVFIVRREAIVARNQRRFPERPVQAPMMYLVVGVIMALGGITLLIGVLVGH